MINLRWQYFSVTPTHWYNCIQYYVAVFLGCADRWLRMPWHLYGRSSITWIQVSLKFVPMSPVNKIPALDLSLDQIKAWHRPGDKPLSEPMLVRLPTHICITRPQWVNKPIQWMFSQHCGYWWPGALAPGHQWLQCWVCTHAFPVV